ncbi:hypothetical protein THRCLA_21800 [Thraustotheca clavata]|uniref:glutathione gamma-glutamylcysteinyltransferase n=1 Tax=Thraustotheca clavata TaxID=74557 RepID=A0A1V9ZPF5_9STRA|nr:hypothetical protein THRCLA_21800 [Thraustotheca clavata]
MDQALVEQPPRRGFCSLVLQVCSIVAGIIVLPIIGILSLPTLLFLFIFKRSVLQAVVQASKYEEFEKAPHYKSPALLARVWATPVGQQYLRGDLEYQQREGYCAIASQRNILKSLPQYPADHLPPATMGAATAKQFAKLLDERSHSRTTSKVVYGDEGFDAFYEAIKLSNDTEYRVTVNFLHATLSGTGSLWLPWNFLFGIVSGHFSVVLGYLEDEDLVAVFDVNSSYGPYLVETRRLYESVAAQDISSNKSRGLIVSKINPPISIV